VLNREVRRAPSGLAFGLALAVRPAGLVEAPGSTARRRRVPRSGMRSTIEAGGTGPDNARRSGPLAVTSSCCDILAATGVLGATLTDWPSCWRTRGSGIRRGPQAAGHRGGRARQPPRRRALRPKDAAKAAAPLRRDPGEPLPPTAGHPGRSFPSTARICPHGSRPGPSGTARRRCALEAVEKLVTALRLDTQARHSG
jgi:hypothetical protein